MYNKKARIFSFFIFFLLFTLFFNLFSINSNGAVFNIANGDVAALISAIQTSNSNNQDDEINLASNGLYTIDGTETGVPFLADGNNGLPSILTDMGSSITINGNDSTIERSSTLFNSSVRCDSASGDDRFRIFHISDDAILNLNDLTLQNGCAHEFDASGSVHDDDGGAVINTGGELNILNCLIQNNESEDGGGGVYLVDADSNTTITDTTVTENTAGGTGGGITNLDGFLIIQKSVVYGNSAPTTAGGGGIRADGTISIINTTISDNSTGGSGGGIQSAGSNTDIINSTIVNNICLSMDPFIGCGVRNIANPLTIKNSIVADNGDGDSVLDNCFGNRNDTFDAGNNLSNDNNNMASNEFCFEPENTNSITDFDVATFLGVLQDNGGPTLTHALLQPDEMNNPNPAVEGVTSNECDDLSNPSNPVSEDQRGVSRPQMTNCDIGAFELGDLDADGDDDCFDHTNFTDTDGDGLVDDCESDTDGDGVNNPEDSDPDDPNICRDTDNDNCDDCINTGADMSGGDPSNDGIDTDGDGICDDGDEDDDNDGVDDGNDSNPTNQQECSDTDGDLCDDCSNTTDSVNQGGNPADDGTDADGDGICSASDQCEDDVDKTEPGQCGCGVADTDTDTDGTADCNDMCVDDPNKTETGVCGCGIADTDTDGDNVEDCIDNCPDDSNVDQADTDGDDIGDVCDMDDPVGDDEDDDDDDVENDIEIDSEGTTDDGVRVQINVGGGIGGGGTILVDLPPQVKPESADLIPNIGDCVIVDPDSDTNVVDVDIVCDVSDFLSEFDLDLELCLEGGDEDAEGIANMEIEVNPDSTDEQFSEFVPLLLTALEGCGDGGGGCSVASVNTTKTIALSNFLVTLIPAMVGFTALFRRRKD